MTTWGNIGSALRGFVLLPVGQLAVALTAVLALLIWWRLPKRQVARLSLKIRDPKARADVEDDYRKTIGQALGGIAVVIAAVVVY